MFDSAFKFVEDREDILREAESVPETAVIAPVPHEDYCAPAAAGDAMHGAHKALVESHVQFDILSSLDIDKLDAYRFAVLTEPCDFAPDVFEKLRSWVENGGTLIAAGDALIQNNSFALSDMFGIEYVEPSMYSVCHFKPRPELAAPVADLQLQCRGPSVKVIPAEAAVVADMYYPEHETTATFSFRNGACPPPSKHPSPYPFATCNNFGYGKAVYVAGSIFSIYWQYNHHWLRQFIEGLFRYVNPQPLYSVDIGSPVETNLMRMENGDWLLNLIHYQVGHQGSQNAIPSIEKVHPLKDVVCRVRDEGIERVVIEPDGIELPFEREQNDVTFTVPEVKYLGMVRLSTGQR